MDPEIAAAFADTRRHFDVVGEQMRGDVRLLAETFSTRIDRLEENLREELLRSQRELSAMIKFSYAELQRRLEGLERHHGELEARVRRLAAEIRRTSSRVSALRTRVVPALEAEVRAIALALEQREREDRFRLKRVKAARERRLAKRAVRHWPGPLAGGTIAGDPERSSSEEVPR